MKKPLWLVPALLLAGCRSEQVAFQFRPAPAAVAAPAAPAPLTTSATAYFAPEVTVAAAPVAAPANAAKPLRPRRLALVLKTLPANALLPLATAAPAVRPLRQHLGRRHATEGAAENGLAGVALFFIGVALAVVAGLGELVNLIFGVGFFTGVGYAAAGLVVLFLLYSLLSGGKKKARTPAPAK